MITSSLPDGRHGSGAGGAAEGGPEAWPLQARSPGGPLQHGVHRRAGLLGRQEEVEVAGVPELRGEAVGGAELLAGPVHGGARGHVHLRLVLRDELGAFWTYGVLEYIPPLVTIQLQYNALLYRDQIIV